MATNDTQNRLVRFGVRSTVVALVLLLATLLVALFVGDKEHMGTNPILILLLGIALTYIGYGPLSLKKNPTAGVGFAAIGLLFRLAGALLLTWDIFLWLFVISMMLPPRMR